MTQIVNKTAMIRKLLVLYIFKISKSRYLAPKAKSHTVNQATKSSIISETSYQINYCKHKCTRILQANYSQSTEASKLYVNTIFHLFFLVWVFLFSWGFLGKVDKGIIRAVSIIKHEDVDNEHRQFNKRIVNLYQNLDWLQISV